MTLQNRVLPTGEIVANPARGTFMGNRGKLHDDNQTLGKPRWRHKNWIICQIAFRGRQRIPMQPGPHYTELFFLDEAVALAAGHRPCGECRNAAYKSYKSALERAWGDELSAKDIDAILHNARVHAPTKRQVNYEALAADLPDGTFIEWQGDAWLVLGEDILRFTPDGYDLREARPEGNVRVLTPRPSVGALRQGYVPVLHETATTGSVAAESLPAPKKVKISPFLDRLRQSL